MLGPPATHPVTLSVCPLAQSFPNNWQEPGQSGERNAEGNREVESGMRRAERGCVWRGHDTSKEGDRTVGGAAGIKFLCTEIRNRKLHREPYAGK